MGCWSLWSEGNISHSQALAKGSHISHRDTKDMDSGVVFTECTVFTPSLAIPVTDGEVGPEVTRSLSHAATRVVALWS